MITSWFILIYIYCEGKNHTRNKESYIQFRKYIRPSIRSLHHIQIHKDLFNQNFSWSLCSESTFSRTSIYPKIFNVNVLVRLEGTCSKPRLFNGLYWLFVNIFLFVIICMLISFTFDIDNKLSLPFSVFWLVSDNYAMIYFNIYCEGKNHSRNKVNYIQFRKYIRSSKRS